VEQGKRSDFLLAKREGERRGTKRRRKKRKSDSGHFLYSKKDAKCTRWLDKKRALKREKKKTGFPAGESFGAK